MEPIKLKRTIWARSRRAELPSRVRNPSPSNEEYKWTNTDKARVGEMNIYLQKVEATFDQIYYEQYLEELKAEAASAASEGRMTEPGEFAPTIARPSKTLLKFDRTVTTPSRATTTSTYSAGNPGAACAAWVSLVRYCGTTEMNKESLSECYCTSGTDNVPDQWNSLAARCATARYKCKDSTDYKCELTDQASSFTDFCDTDGTTVRFHTNAKPKIARQTTDDSWMGSSASDDDEDEDEDHSIGQGSDDDSGSEASSDDTAAEPAAAQPKPTSSATQAPLTTTSASPGSTRTANTSRTSSSSVSSTIPSATSTSSAQSAGTRVNVLVYRVAQFWLPGICALWLL